MKIYYNTCTIMNKLLVLYVFHIYNDRVKHFIENCIFYDENVDFIIISNNKDNKFETPSPAYAVKTRLSLIVS